MSDVGIAGENGVDMRCESGELVLVDSMLRTARSASHGNTATTSVARLAAVRRSRRMRLYAAILSTTAGGITKASRPLRTGAHAHPARHVSRNRVPPLSALGGRHRTPRSSVSSLRKASVRPKMSSCLN
ncbi:hypothetical protein KC330_g36 [Hortaea werneckii]|nr:hypothetical protein KC330_g36 [Hortaea werneckii]